MEEDKRNKMGFKCVEGTNWVINQDEMLYENSQAPGFYLRKKNTEYIFKNMDEFVLALKDTGEVFENIFNIPVKQENIEILYCGKCPVSLRTERKQIGIHRTGNTYVQDMYQFSHELFHAVMLGVIPQRHAWFEESLCALSSLVVLNKTYLKYILRTPERALNIRRYALSNCIPQKIDEIGEGYINQWYNTVIKIIEKYIINRKFEQVCALFLEPIVEQYGCDLGMFLSLPHTCEGDFITYMNAWGKELGNSQKGIAEMIKNLFIL